jgi:SNF2 family DNA or RNA helicase
MQILTLLLRLRQCCDHVFLILARKRTGDEFEADINRFIHKFASRVDLSAPGAPSVEFLTSLSEDLKKTGADRAECPICLDTPQIPVLTECAHLLCRECLSPLFNERGFARCPICRAIVNREKLFLVPDQLDNGDDHDRGDGSGGGGGGSSSNTSRRIDPVANWSHSSKTRRLLEELEAIRAGADPKAKSIIFSQWTAMLDLLEIPLRDAGFEFLRLDGSLAQKERESVLNKFKSQTNTPILLISLKAGGCGLNLVMANYVFFMDCWSVRNIRACAHFPRCAARAVFVLARVADSSSSSCFVLCVVCVSGGIRVWKSKLASACIVSARRRQRT